MADKLMALGKKNIRTLAPTTGSGSDFRDTDVTSGQAKKTADFTDTNEIKEYRTTMKGTDGAKGGRNTSM